MPEDQGSAFDFVEQIEECQMINTQVTERHDRLVEGFKRGQQARPSGHLTNLNLTAGIWRPISRRLRRAARTQRRSQDFGQYAKVAPTFRM
jgi:hypothetical protein